MIWYVSKKGEMIIMGLSENQANFIHKIATGSRKVRNLFTPIGFLFFLSLMTLIVFVSLWVDKLLGLPRFIPELYRFAIGLPIFAIGLFMVVWSVFCFVMARGTPVPFNPPPALVTSGPYTYVRNPMLTGVFIAMFGLGLLLDSIALAFIFTPLSIVLSVHEIKRIEEPELERRLGSAYIEYKKRVPRFFPMLRVKREVKV